MTVTRDPTVPNPAFVVVSPAKGEYLRFLLDASGPIPIWTFTSDVKGVIYQAADFIGHPRSSYEWLHLKNPSDIQQQELLVQSLVFITCPNYTYTIELWGKTSLKRTVLQIAYDGTPAELPVTESITVVIQ